MLQRRKRGREVSTIKTTDYHACRLPMPGERPGRVALVSNQSRSYRSFWPDFGKGKIKLTLVSAGLVRACGTTAVRCGARHAPGVSLISLYCVACAWRAPKCRRKLPRSCTWPYPGSACVMSHHLGSECVSPLAATMHGCGGGGIVKLPSSRRMCERSLAKPLRYSAAVATRKL